MVSFAVKAFKSSCVCGRGVVFFLSEWFIGTKKMKWQTEKVSSNKQVWWRRPTCLCPPRIHLSVETDIKESDNTVQSTLHSSTLSIFHFLCVPHFFILLSLRPLLGEMEFDAIGEGGKSKFTPLSSSPHLVFLASFSWSCHPFVSCFILFFNLQLHSFLLLFHHFSLSFRSSRGGDAVQRHGM